MNDSLHPLPSRNFDMIDNAPDTLPCETWQSVGHAAQRVVAACRPNGPATDRDRDGLLALRRLLSSATMPARALSWVLSSPQVLANANLHHAWIYSVFGPRSGRDPDVAARLRWVLDALDILQATGFSGAQARPSTSRPPASRKPNQLALRQSTPFFRTVPGRSSQPPLPPRGMVSLRRRPALLPEKLTTTDRLRDSVSPFSLFRYPHTLRRTRTWNRKIAHARREVLSSPADREMGIPSGLHRKDIFFGASRMRGVVEQPPAASYDDDEGVRRQRAVDRSAVCRDGTRTAALIKRRSKAKHNLEHLIDLLAAQVFTRFAGPKGRGHR